jgi:TldD protein
MSNEQLSKELFFKDCDFSTAESLVNETLAKADDGELYLEHRLFESLVLEDGTLKNASFNASQGFGLRGVLGETVAYAHASDITKKNFINASKTVNSSLKRQGVMTGLAKPPSGALYKSENIFDHVNFDQRIAVLKEIDAYTRSLDPRVKNVSVSLLGEWRVVGILRKDGHYLCDIRPLIRLNIQASVKKDSLQETGFMGTGGRNSYQSLLMHENWEPIADEAVRQAILNLNAIPAPAGEMTVVLGNGWPGVLLHEAVGHGLEGDFNRKKTSAFSELLGKQVAAKGVTVVDDGTIPGRRGSLTIDDEGTPTERTVLIEDGILVGYMQDRLNSRLMKMKPTGNGRRESYAHAPMPRMTNTFMTGGNHDPEEIIKSVKKGLYAANFGGGQVDITSGQFVFSAVEAYLIENGKITTPVKGATLVGSGPEVLKKVTMIGNDPKLDSGIGSCGKNGQWVPVGVGQPTLKVSSMTVGGTEV